MFTRSRFMAVAVCAMSALSATAAVMPDFPTNVAPLGTVYAGSLIPQGNACVNDGNIMTNADFSDWVAVVWNTPQTLDRIIVDLRSGYEIPLYEVQIAKPNVANPDYTNDADWYSLGQFSSPNYAFSPAWATAGVRVKALDYGGFGVARIGNIWAFENYDNLALQATFSSAGWGSQGFNDERFSQLYNGGWPSGDTYIYATFNDGPVTLAGSCIVGGSGADNEYLVEYTIEYYDYDLADWVEALSVTGNTNKMDWRTFDQEGTSDQWRLNVIHVNDANSGARVSEIMLFAPVPEPATMTLLVLGGCLALRRRSRR